MKKWLVNHIVKFISRIILKIDSAALKEMPMQGPLLVVVNHINFLDAPVIISLLHPRPTTGLVKKETWENPLFAFLFTTWETIPIDRDIADFKAFRMAKAALKDGKILAVAPEGTRTGSGEMIRAKAGISFLASQCDVPILAVAHWGHENFSENIKKLKRSPMHIRLGKPFKIDFSRVPKNKETMQDIADAIMVEIAKLLPEQYHGYYAQKQFESQKFINYLD